MADVVFCSRLFEKLDISLYRAVFAFGTDSLVAVFLCVFAVVDISALEQVVYLAVGGDYLAESLSLGHGLTHHFVALNSPSVVRKRNCVGS